MEYAGSIIILLLQTAGTICTTAGTGVIVPISMMFFGFRVKDSIYLANSCIVTAAIIRYLLNLKTKPCSQTLSRLPFKYAALVLPLLSLGSIIGLIMTQILPPIVIAIVSAISLAAVVGIKVKQTITYGKK